MSGRALASAQNRRGQAPPIQQPQRGPQPSINSAQMFANQARPGAGPNIPPGRLAAQQLQQSQQFSSPQVQSQNQKDGLASISKMTIAQAITLITLRLGAVESKIMSADFNPSTDFMSGEGHENMVLLDKKVLESITSRLESLEKRGTTSVGTSGTGSNGDVMLLKQQIEVLKPSIVQSKNAISVAVKENKELKATVETLRKELNETKELLNAVHHLTMDNSQKILGFAMMNGEEFEGQFSGEFNEEVLDANNSVLEDADEIAYLDNEGENQEIVETNLKELIENEINSSNL